MCKPIVDAARAKAITTKLLCWYDENKRDLPWRHAKEPYHIWISEIMAQQTRIQFLLAYYNRFITLFPTVESLAAAPEEEVLKAWEGLGYYSRAKNLQKAARVIVQDYSGRIPDTKEELIALPGIGEYTAGAILSIAYDKPVPAVDGNVLRVFARLEDDDTDIMQPAAKRTTAKRVEQLFPAARAGCFTQALMELGALVCIPQNPKCENCPLVQDCYAFASHRQHILPIKAAKAAPKECEKTVLVIVNETGEILMRQRSETLLSGLWEFYMAEGRLTERQAMEHLCSLGFVDGVITPMGAAKHVFSHIIWHMTGYMCRVRGKILLSDYCWVDADTRAKLAVPAAFRHYVHQLSE
ncbi:MAG: A/G-specific adenine glycosylase [Clostridiales bacterium]|nr:A/G-specific adenine glycosylase [Clostridiales bacterium]